jgi:hypothetical protein
MVDEANGPGGERTSQVVALPSGTTLTVRADTAGEEILLRSAAGRLELRIRMTDEGPVLSLQGVRLEIEAADRVAVNCREFAVHARDGMTLSSEGDVQVRSDADIAMRSAGSTFIDADYVNLNCLDRTGYHDHVPEDAVQSTPEKGAPPAGED